MMNLLSQSLARLFRLAACTGMMAATLNAPAANASATPIRPKITGISHVAFHVSDLPKAQHFWHDQMGFDQYFSLPKKDGSGTRIAFFKLNDRQHIELFNEPSPRAPNMLAHVGFSTDDLEGMRIYLRSRGIKVADSNGGKTKAGDYAFMIKDPDGMLVEFVQSLPDGVEAKAAGKFMPAERVSSQIYHVGFTVGNSAKSIDFYGGILGFQETWRGGGNPKELSWINMRVPDGVDYVEFMLYKAPLTASQYGTKNHVALEVPDAAAVIDTLHARAAFADYGKQLSAQVGRNGKRQVNIFDPDGTRAEVMEPHTHDGKAVPSSTAPPPPNAYE
jgi:catechol 2,3-dioxygenase-like lactoylglutathione lyase family enzyme